MGYKGTGEVTYCPINSSGTVAAGATSTLEGVRPQKPFQPKELLIDADVADVFDIVDIKFGNQSIAVAAGAVSGKCFPPDNGPKFEWNVVDGTDIIFTVANTKTNVTIAFQAMLIGEVVTGDGSR